MSNLLNKVWARKTVTLYAAPFLLLVACTNANTQAGIQPNRTADECLPQSVSVSFPLHVTTPPDYVPPPAFIPSNWSPQLSDEQLGQLDSRRFYDIEARSADDIWFITDRSLWRYQPNDRKLTFYTIQISDFGSFSPNRIALSSGGTLWASGIATINGDYRGFLSYYDSVENRFIYVPELDDLLEGSPDWLDIDGQGVVWLVDDNRLIRFEPTARHAELINLPSTYNISTLTVTPEGMLWLGVAQVEHNYSELIRYDPITATLHSYGQIPGRLSGNQYLSPGSLFLDHGGRVWIGDVAYLDFSSNDDGTWYQIVPSPIFVMDGQIPEQRYAWIHPNPIYQSSSDVIWFDGATGLATLDLQQGKWCLVTNRYGAVTGDDAGNLWFAVAGQIYRLH